MNTEIIIALIGMASAVWAPTVTAYVNRNKELRMKKLEIYQQCKKDAYINFSMAFSKIYRLMQPELDDAVKEIISASHQVLIYCSKPTSEKIIELIRYTNSMPLIDINVDEFKQLLYEVMQLLNAEIKQDSK